MSKIVVSISAPFTKPRETSTMVVFSDDTAFIPEPESEGYLLRCRDYASQYEVSVVPSRFVARGYLCMCMIDPDGSLKGIQKATHLNLAYKKLNKRGDDISVFDTALGKIFLCVDCDIYHPEVLRAAKLKGAQVVISSQYIDTFEYSENNITYGAWSAAQSNLFYVVNVNNHTRSISAPLSITENGSGYLVPPGDTINFLARLYLNKLSKADQNLGLDNFPRSPLYEKYFNELIG